MSRSLQQSARWAERIQTFTQQARQLRGARALHAMSADELRKLDDELQRLRESVAYARDIAIAHDAATAKRGRA